MSRQEPKPFHRYFWHGVLGLAFLNLLLFGDILFFGRGLVLSSSRADLYLHFAAWRQFAFDQLRQGHLVLWNPHYLCGTPFLGNFESALLYPPNWFYLILPSAVAINFGIVLHVFLAGFFTYLWATDRGLHPLAGFTAGTVFMFGGAFYLHLFAGHLPNLCAMVWAPLIFLALDGLIERGSARRVLLGVFAVSMQILAGHPQYVYFTALVAVLYVSLHLIGRESKLRIMGRFLVIYAGAFLLTAVQLWTGIQAFLECSRNVPMEFAKASSFSFPPQNTLTMILPEFFGNLRESHYWSQWFLWEVSLFTGMGAFFLVVTAIFSGAPLVKRWAFPTAVAAFFFSLGSFTPLYQLFYHFVPLFKGMRGVCKFDFLASLFLALIAGVGLDYLMKNKKIQRGPVLVAGMAALVFLGAEIWILNSIEDGLRGAWGKWFLSIGWLKKSFSTMDISLQGKILREAGMHAALSLLIGGCSGLFLTILFSIRKIRPAVIYALVGMIVLELFVFARLNRPTFELAALQKKMDQIKSVYQKDPGEYRVYGTGSASLVTGGYDLWEDEPMVLGRYGRFVCYSQGLLENQLFSVLPIYTKFNKTFSMLRLKYLFSDDGDFLTHFAVPFKPLPRMLLVNRWEVLPDGSKILPALFDPGFDPETKIYLESAPNPAPDSAKGVGVVSWNDLSTDRVEIKADVQKASLLLVTDNYAQGWRADPCPESVQKAYTVLPGDYFLRVIPLSAGKHHFILEYKPSAFTAGKWVSLFSCLIYVGMIVFYFRKRAPFH